MSVDVVGPAQGVDSAPIDRLLDEIERDPSLRKRIESYSDEQAEALLFDWLFWARPNQLLPEEDFDLWFLLAGRGWGKTKTAAECIKVWHAEGFGRFAFVARTESDYRDTMIEGDSGILSVYRKTDRPRYIAARRLVEWPNGATALLFSSKTPDSLRGPQFEKGWGDEVASWYNPSDTWDNFEMAVRLGINPQIVASTTPKPIHLIRRLLKKRRVTLSSGSTYENARNLSPKWFRLLLETHEGTRKGEQELHAKLLDEAEGALWKRKWIDDHKRAPDYIGPMADEVIAIDPADGTEDGDEHGIAHTGRGVDGRYYLFDSDGTRDDPATMLKQAVLWWWQRGCSTLVAEKNHGGAWIRSTLEQMTFTLPAKDGDGEITLSGLDVPLKVVHASQGKRTRAEPVAAMYEQGRVSHVGRRVATEHGPAVSFAHLEVVEDQMTNWTGLEPGEASPDRMDAVVWGVSHLRGTSKPATISSPASHRL